MAFLPRGFVVPAPVEQPRFTLRHITVHDVVRDYDAVMSSRERLWEQFGEVWGWPAADLTIEQDLIDLAWHQKEGDLRRAFNFAVLSPDGGRLLGCVYVDPPEKAGADADVAFWVRTSEAETGLEAELETFVRRWLAEEWPFDAVRYPGRDLSWAEWEALPDR
ncbi:GNAT family N-acetyltransferase [Motilibacter deserti]|uniref:GNAT family N-acetyltransferase n=1 Tax=Motilibacter deserti TaxID=2714956 RepID=A0ABX0H3B5_9ACTN|nr:GNAT family N-acetyltransferase [Motilibacter deserti]NHC16366.1 GNAT family N-acetyltransferase [Motilibacter deserti]